MSKMYRCIDILKDPCVVANIQNFFGVSYKKTPTEQEPYSQESSSFIPKRNNINDTDVEGKREDEELSHKFKNGCLTVEEPCSQTEAGNRNLSDAKKQKNYTIRSKFWFLLFFFGTYLGDDIGYAIFLPFWFWNVDAKIGRKIVLVWTIIMYIGQTSKDVICWPRPSCPPVIRLQKKWALEYGMPSTHAMVGVALPSSVLYYTSRRYQFPVEFGVTVAIIWCILISLSRLYLGMHTVLDVLAGLLLSSLLVIPLLPFVDRVGDILIEYYWVPPLIIAISVILIVVYPTGNGNIWTPTRGDTTTILATCAGIQTAAWLHFQLGWTQVSSSSLPFYFHFPEWSEIGLIALRTFVGYAGIVFSFIIFEFVQTILDWLLVRMKVTVRNGNSNRRVPFIDLIYKYLTYSITSFHVACSLPYFFKFLNIGRSTYYLE